MTEEELLKEVFDIPYWYHRIKLPYDIETRGWAPLDASAYKLPERFDGERILDIGSWDGYWTWHALERGASYVVAIDDFSDSLGSASVDRSEQWKTWDLCQKALGYTNCQRLTMSVYDIASLGVEFDRVVCFGVLYHLKHPTWALEKLRSVTTKSIHIESAVLDKMTSPYTKTQLPTGACHAEFYPNDEFGKNSSNWWVPSLSCLAGWLQATGWSNVQTWPLTEYPMHLAHCRGYASATVI
jgi:tRNA (mo5U34)-methyltransferase